ncbi:carbohydrate porin [Parvibaculum sedimenti]|uniref:carbohydrate porin n=1 Tax=Parvibaculum sedimenti TaxID=2608632 RepID=UPI0019573D19|nr:carbohydrate porin [Parvibaculum sedimenti]
MKMLCRALATASLLGVSMAALPAMADEKNLWEQDTLTGDWGGTRSELADQGIEIGLAYIGEALGDVSGGMKRGWSYEGRAELSLDLDLDKLFGWQGGTAHASAYQIHHTNGLPTADYTGSIGAPSNIEARQATRLFTLWVQQNFLDDAVSIRAGQLAADDEFMTSDTAGNLINGTFGWAGIAAANQTNGGPAYPLATPGVRVAVAPTKSVTVLGAVFSGDPAGEDCFDDAQVCNRHGTTFSMSGGTLWMGEVQYASNQGEGGGLPGVYKLGAWYQTGKFADQRYGFERSNDHGVYAIADQTIWRKGESDALSLFARVGGAPSDRNLVSFYADGGLAYKGLIPGRDEDVLAFGAAYAKISGDARDADRDLQLLASDPAYPLRDQETVFELSYTAAVTPWWSVQPDVQYIVHPGGNVENPEDAMGAKIDNALVVGVRTSLTF